MKGEEEAAMGAMGREVPGRGHRYGASAFAMTQWYDTTLSLKS